MREGGGWRSSTLLEHRTWTIPRVEAAKATLSELASVEILERLFSPSGKTAAAAWRRRQPWAVVVAVWPRSSLRLRRSSPTCSRAVPELESRA